MGKNLLTIANHPARNDLNKWAKRATARGCEWVFEEKKMQIRNLRGSWKIELAGFSWLREIAAHEKTKTVETLAEVMRLVWAMEAQNGNCSKEKELWLEW